MTTDIRNFIDHCIPCARFRRKLDTRNPLQPMTAGHPWQMVGVDVIGPLTTTKRSNKYIVCFVDYFTKWPESFATKDQTAETITNLLLDQIIPRHGVPEVIVSDQGPAFVSKAFTSEVRALGIKVNFVTPYHHQANGLVERWNQTLVRNDQTTGRTLLK